MSSFSRKRRKNRRRPYFHRQTPPGAAPGTLKADPEAHKPIIQLIAYGNDQFVELELKENNLDVVRQYLGKYPVVWLNVDGLGNDRVVAEIGRIFNLHALALEDVINAHQRAKVEEYPDYLFITARMLIASERLDTEQISAFLGKNYLVTFQELPGDVFDPVRESLRRGRKSLTGVGPDYLAYALLDAVIDAFFPTLERYGEMLDNLEEEVVATPDLACIARIHDVKNDLIQLRRAIWPQREAINTLLRDTHAMVTDNTRLHLRDCYDHTVQIIDLVEVYREIASGLTDLYVSGVSNRMNEVMKVLTIIATIFIPLTFVTSIYGMNFNTQVSHWNMPELNWRYGYLAVWTVMLAVAIGMFYFFWRKGWLRSFSTVPRRRLHPGDGCPAPGVDFTSSVANNGSNNGLGGDSVENGGAGSNGAGATKATAESAKR